jgi:hypothetical protein
MMVQEEKRTLLCSNQSKNKTIDRKTMVNDEQNKTTPFCNYKIAKTSSYWENDQS